MSAGADPAPQVGRERWALHPSLSRPSLRSSGPGLHRDGRALGLDLDRRASNGPLLDGRLGLETVDAAEGVENACWCISRAHEGVQIACRVYVECARQW